MHTEAMNIAALNKLKDSLSEKEEFGRDGFKFKGLVTYEASGIEVNEILEIYLIFGGYEPMIKLDVQELGRKITSNDYHMDFNPKYSNSTKFEFIDHSKILVIIGKKSPRIGDYKVSIKEINHYL